MTRNYSYSWAEKFILKEVKTSKSTFIKRLRVHGDLHEAFKWMKGINKGDINKVLREKSG